LSGLKAAWNNVTGFVGSIGSWIADHKGPLSYDATLLTPAGLAIMSGLHGGLSTGFGAVQALVGGMGGDLADAFATPGLGVGMSASGGSGSAGYGGMSVGVGAGGSQRVVLEFAPGTGDLFIEAIRNAIRVRGGNAQKVLSQ
jgi:phage-related protein